MAAWADPHPTGEVPNILCLRVATVWSNLHVARNRSSPKSSPSLKPHPTLCSTRSQRAAFTEGVGPGFGAVGSTLGGCCGPGRYTTCGPGRETSYPNECKLLVPDRREPPSALFGPGAGSFETPGSPEKGRSIHSSRVALGAAGGAAGPKRGR